MPAKHGITTDQQEYLSYTMVKPFDLLNQHGSIDGIQNYKIVIATLFCQ